MKTERRHELQTNVLADYIGKHLQQVKPYSRHITIGVLLILAAVMAGLYFYNKSAAETGASWSDYSAAFAATDPDALEEVAKLHDGSTAALWARQSAGDIRLAMGTGQLFTDREEAEKTLKGAEEHFLAVEKDASHPQLVERARYGLAQLYASLSDIEKAQKYCDLVTKSSPNSALGKAAKRRFKRLSDKSVQRWYAWFERQEPVPPPMPPGGPGGEPRVSDDLDMLPERPDLSFPGSSISEQLRDMDLDAPLDKATFEPMSTEPKETPATNDDEETAAPESGGTPKPDDSASEPQSTDEGAESATEAAKDAEKPAPQPEESTPADTAKPIDNPTASDVDDTKPESKHKPS